MKTRHYTGWSSRRYVEPEQMADLAALRKEIDTWAAELGFQQIGVTDVDLSAHEPHVRA